jgi:hypothetical protein
MAEQGAAPAICFARIPGRPGSVVRSYYEGLQVVLLDDGLVERGESLRDQDGRGSSGQPRKNGSRVKSRRLDGAPRGGCVSVMGRGIQERPCACRRAVRPSPANRRFPVCVRRSRPGC